MGYGPLGPGTDPIKLFTAVIYEFSKKARVFVPGKPLHPSLMFAGKARPYEIEGPDFRVGSCLTRKH